MNEKLEKLKKVIQEANPEIMELKLGCQFLVDEKENPNWKQEVFTVLNYRDIHYISIHENKFINAIHKNEIKTILGRPIVWDDVAIALKRFNKYSINCHGQILEDRDDNLPIVNVCAGWIFGKNLDEQEEKTINWLLEILGGE